MSELNRGNYRGYPAVSQSDLKACWDNAKLYYLQSILKCLTKPGPSESKVFGTLMEEYLRTGKTPSDMVEIPNDVLSASGSRAGAKWKEWVAQQPDGVHILKSGEFGKMLLAFGEAKLSIMRHPAAKALVCEDAQWHRHILWSDPTYNLILKAELDIWHAPSSSVVDIKTSACESPHAFERDVISYGYDIQAAQYCDAMRAMGEEVEGFVWVVVRNSVPHNCEVYEASAELLEFGAKRLDERKAFYSKCVETKNWESPTYGSVVSLRPPAWARRELEMTSVEGA